MTARRPSARRLCMARKDDMMGLQGWAITWPVVGSLTCSVNEIL